MNLMDIPISIFKDYDVRGIYPQQINEEVFELVAQEFSFFFKPKVVSLGKDNRPSSEKLFLGMVKGFLKQGVDVVDLGLITTDMIYFAAGKYKYDLNIMITGSHAQDKNGFKICKKGAIPISGESGLYQVRDRLIKRNSFPRTRKRGRLKKKDILNDWIYHALSFVNLKTLRPFKIAVDTGNGVGGLVMGGVEKKLPGNFYNLFFELDGTFPNHFPNPLIEDNLKDIRKKIKEVKADFGIAFDADGDRAFILNEKDETVNGSILTALISKSILEKNPGETVLYNSVCGRIVPQTIEKYGGRGIRVRVGHSLIKEKMREFNAVFAGEHSGHFYFRDNFYSDSGLIATLKVLEIISKDGRGLSQITKEFEKYAQSGEINFEVDDKLKVIKLMENEFKDKALSIDYLDGLSVWFNDWWFNLRPSNTEELLRLNCEADNQIILRKNLFKIIKMIKKFGGRKI